MKKKFYLSGILVMGVLFFALSQNVYANSQDVNAARSEQTEGFTVKKTSYLNAGEPAESANENPQGFLEVSYAGDARETLPEGDFVVHKCSITPDALQMIQ